MEPTTDPTQTTPATPAEPTADTGYVPLQDLSREDLQKARETGRPIKRVTPKTEESAPPASAEQTASTEASSEPASEPGDPATSPAKAKEKPRTRETRVQQLRAENVELEAELRRRSTLRRALAESDRSSGDPTTAASPAAPDSKAPPTQKDWQRLAEHPDAPKVGDYDHVEQFVAAQSHFIVNKVLEERDAKAQQQQQVTAKESAFRETASRSYERFVAYVESKPDVAIHPELMQIIPLSLLPEGQKGRAENFIAEQMVDSDYPGQLAEYFSTDEGAAEFRALLVKTPAQIVRRMGQIEAGFAQGGATLTPSPTKHLTEAPAPPKVNLGKKPAGPVDDFAAATKNGDVRTARAAMLARDARP